ncbi:MAG: hypothetical protein GKR93_04510 [Gammaproteobacteria bacterium]|nr:hypothetical protein [Gammaproteobacteria bacterium]
MNKSFLLVFASIFLLTGCMSIPSQTEEKLQSFGEEYFTTFDPADIRVRIIANNDNPLFIDKTTINFNVECSVRGIEIFQRNLKGHVVLESKDDLTPSKGLNPFEFKREHIYTIKFDDEAIKTFKNIQTINSTIIKTFLDEGELVSKKKKEEGTVLSYNDIQTIFSTKIKPKVDKTNNDEVIKAFEDIQKIFLTQLKPILEDTNRDKGPKGYFSAGIGINEKYELENEPDTLIEMLFFEGGEYFALNK